MSPTLPSSRLGRRPFLGLLSAGALAGVTAGCGMGGSGSTVNGKLLDATSTGPLTEPTVLRSANGRLTVELVAAATMLSWQGGERYALAYGGSVPGATWRVQPGDVIEVAVRNELDQPTNLHTHGLHVSPSGNSDDPSIMIEPGQTFSYRFELPTDHPSGTFWYHPHHHGNSAMQVFGGLAGAIVVEDEVDRRLSGMTERVLVLSDPRIGSTAKVLGASTSVKQQGREGDVLLVNGQYRPTATALVGQTEHWRIVNASPSRYYVLSIDGASMQWIGSGQRRFTSPRSANAILLTPGQRAEVLVPFAGPGTVTLRSSEYDRHMTMSMSGMGNMGGMMGGSATTVPLSVTGAITPLFSVDVSEPPRSGGSPIVLPADITGGDPFVVAPPSATRQVTFGSMSMGDREFVIDGKSYEPGRIDAAARFGTTEDWVITNGSMMDHPFHLHTWPFRVVARSNGDPEPGWQDTVNVPMGQSVTIRIPFTGFAGRTVYHCHILDHEDLGMMATIEVA